MAKKVEKKPEPKKVKVVKAPKAEVKPKTKKINKSAKDGKIVSKDFAKDNPDTTFEQVVSIADARVEIAPIPEPVPVESVSKFFRDGDHIIEICGDVITKHWVENGVHCTEGVELIELSDAAEEMSRSEMFRELNG